MNKLSMVIPKMKFSINFHNPNLTVYHMPKPDTMVSAVHKHRQLFSRKVTGEVNKTDVFVPEVQEVKPLDNAAELNVTTVPAKKKVHKESSGRYSKEELAKYFDNDNLRRDYFAELAEESEKEIQAQTKLYREVENADTIRDFVESKRAGNPFGKNYNAAHGYDVEELTQNYLKSSK